MATALQLLLFVCLQVEMSQLMKEGGEGGVASVANEGGGERLITEIFQPPCPPPLFSLLKIKGPDSRSPPT